MSEHALEDAPTEEAEAPEPSEVPWRRLHPASVAVNLIPQTWAFLRQNWGLLAAMWLGSRSAADGVANLGILSLFFGMSISRTILHFFTLRYRVVAGRLEIRTGLLNRRQRILPADRIQNVETVRNLFHKIAGLVEVRIETASGTEVEGELSALSVEAARDLTEALAGARGRTEEAQEEGELLVHNGIGELLAYGVTSARLGSAAIAFGLLFEYAPIAMPTELFSGLAGAAAATVAIVTGAWLVGIVGTFVSHHDFRLSLVGGRLVAEQGFFTRRRMEMAVRKVQLVAVVEPWVRRMLGFGSVLIETAAPRKDAGGMMQAVTRVPVADPEVSQEVLDRAFPDLSYDLQRSTLRPPAPKALRRATLRALLQGGAAAGGFMAFFQAFPLILIFLVVPVGMVLLARAEFRVQGWDVTERAVIARKGLLRRTTMIVARHRIQSATVVQGPLLRRYGLGRVEIRVAGNVVALPLIEQDRAEALVSRLLPTD